VHVLKIVDSTLPAAAPEINVRCPASSNAGAEATFSAQADAATPALVYRWDFGDGVQADGAQVKHTWTEAGDYEIHLTATGLDDFQAEKNCRVHVTGHLPTVFTPSAKKRYESK